MGINVKVQKYPKAKDILTVEVKAMPKVSGIEKDLRECMRCRFFYGSNSQCITRKCVKGNEKLQAAEENRESECFGCQYRQSEKYCFPCMKRLLGLTEENQHEENIRQEEKGNG